MEELDRVFILLQSDNALANEMGQALMDLLRALTGHAVWELPLPLIEDTFRKCDDWTPFVAHMRKRLQTCDNEKCYVPALSLPFTATVATLAEYLQTGNNAFESGESKDAVRLPRSTRLVAWLRLSSGSMRSVLESAKAKFSETTTAAILSTSDFVPTAAPSCLDSKQTNSGAGSLHRYARLVTRVFEGKEADAEVVKTYAHFLQLRLLCLLAHYCARLRFLQTGGTYDECARWIALLPALILAKFCRQSDARFAVHRASADSVDSLEEFEREVQLSAESWRAARHANDESPPPWLSVVTLIDLYTCFLRTMLQQSAHVDALRESVCSRAFAPLLAAVDGVLAHPDDPARVQTLKQHLLSDAILSGAVPWCADLLLRGGLHVGVACALRAIILHYRAAVTDEQNGDFNWRLICTPASKAIVCGCRDRNQAVDDYRTPGRLLVVAFISYVRSVMEDLETVRV